MNKHKIINDPVYGFIRVQSDLIFDLIEHPWFQRLRRIRQLGFTDYVYPGALHTRFHHALGAMHLMGVALQTVRGKGHEVSEKEYESALAAALLHDIGHGPFSHALEGLLVKDVLHEELTRQALAHLNIEFRGALDMTIQMFENSYERPFFHQLISGQLDVDRLDYLARDSFYTGVSEGNVGVERILHMFDLADGNLVVEEKGIYSIESFLTARRIMYWQVYMHKTSICIEQMMVELIKRARYILGSGSRLEGDPVLIDFLDKYDAKAAKSLFPKFALLDDYSVICSLKGWATNNDPVLRILSKSILDRKLFRIYLKEKPFKSSSLLKATLEAAEAFDISKEDASFLVMSGTKTNSGYIDNANQIHILGKDGEVREISNVSGLPGIKALSKPSKKYYVCIPKNLSL